VQQRGEFFSWWGAFLDRVEFQTGRRRKSISRDYAARTVLVPALPEEKNVRVREFQITREPRRIVKKKKGAASTGLSHRFGQLSLFAPRKIALSRSEKATLATGFSLDIASRSCIIELVQVCPRLFPRGGLTVGRSHFPRPTASRSICRSSARSIIWSRRGGLGAGAEFAADSHPRRATPHQSQ